MAALMKKWTKTYMYTGCLLKHSLLYFRSDKMVRNSSTSPMNMLDLTKRGLFESVFPDQRIPDLPRLLSSPQSIYCGFDPTADSLHIGNLLSLIALIHGQRAGHNPIAVIGGATVVIGDPSGKTKDREPIQAEVIENNVIALMENVNRIVHNHEQYICRDKKPLPKFRILNNKEWYSDQNVITFLATVGRQFRVGEMIAKHSVKSRLNSKQGISCTEFMYQVFQAYDWLHLYRNYNCSIQIGGGDQMGNISSGFDLIDKVTKKQVFGLLVPLLLTSGGEKLGKSSGNSLWLDPTKTSPYELYQYFFNIADSDVERYLKLFTFLPLSEIEAIMEKQNRSPEQRHAQRKLGEQVTLLVHGEDGIDSALKCTEVLFGDAVPAIASMKLTDLQQLFKNASTSELIYDPEMTVFELCVKIKCFKREGDVERTIKEGGVYINQQRFTEPYHILREREHILPNNITLVRVGKKTYHVVHWLMR
ncbi:tyrosine--tRNA ligase, mitochondrial-like [Physella acuta]|uniref:tyrosine--tRNA ligase, mitochondrial-like n=1 Tax=Physella acuta TaxID=109671 RepID=UPI0027DD0EFE|nr:tyrosine--tRNA ligase, mitochondrial-like [Physella acuta]